MKLSNQRGLLQPLVLVLGLGLIVGILAATQNGLFKVKKESEKPVFFSDSPETVVKELKNYLSKHTEYKFEDVSPENAYHLWLSEDGYLIFNRQASSISGKGSFNNPSVLPTNFLSKDIPAVKEFVKGISETFLANSFAHNIQNSLVLNEDRSRLRGYVWAFQRGETRCTLTVYPDLFFYLETKPFEYDITIGCSDKFQENYKEQLPYLKALGLKSGSTGISDVIKVGDFVRVVRWGGGGGYEIGRWENGQFKRIIGGQDYPLCKMVDELQLPKEIYENCYEENDEPRFPL